MPSLEQLRVYSPEFNDFMRIVKESQHYHPSGEFFSPNACGIAFSYMVSNDDYFRVIHLGLDNLWNYIDGLESGVGKTLESAYKNYKDNAYGAYY